MSMEFANRICPNCKNPNYMVFLGDFSKVYKYKCMNCNRYFNDIDFDEPPEPVWKTEWMNKKIDMVEVVRCKDCKAWKQYDDMNLGECELYPEYNKMGEWFCNFGERKEGR